jgi:hypothetical protein
MSKLSKEEKLEYKTQKNSLPSVRREGLAAMTLRNHNEKPDTQPETQSPVTETLVETTKTRPLVPKRPRGRPRKTPIEEKSNLENEAEGSSPKSLDVDTQVPTDPSPPTPQQLDPIPEAPPRIPWVMNAPSWCERMTDSRPIPPKNPFERNVPPMQRTTVEMGPSPPTDMTQDQVIPIPDIDTSDRPQDSIEMNMRNMAELQQKDKWIREMKCYISTNVLPSSDTDAREILLSQDHFYCENDILYHVHETKTSPKTLYNQVVVPESLIPELLNQSHDSLVSGGHVNYSKLYQKLLPHVYFKNMFSRSKAYANSCLTCGERKIPRNQTKAPMRPQPIANTPFGTVVIDYIGPITPSFGRRYMLVMICEFTRYAVVVPTTSMDASVTARALMDHLILVYGCPNILKSDNGAHLSTQSSSNWPEY